MSDGEKKDVRLSDIIDVKFLKEIQNSFSRAVKFPSVIIDKYGYVTTPSEGKDFCYKYTRGTELGSLRCQKCGEDHEKMALEQGKPIIYHCHTGLIDFIVPLIVNGKCIARIMCGQVLDQKPDENHFREVARELGIDEEVYIEALKDVKVFPKEHIEAAANLLFSTGNIIAEMAEKNLRMKAINEKAKNVIKNEKFLREIIAAYIKTKDVQKLYNFILYKTAKLFNAERGIFIVQNPDLSKDNIITDYQEYLAYPTVSSISKKMPSKALIKRIFEKLMKHDIIYGNTKNNTVVTNPELLELLETLNVKTFMNVPIYSGDTSYGCIILHYTSKERDFTEEDINLLKAIAGQAATVINQANLYSSIEKNEKYTQKVISNIQDIVITTDENFVIQTCNCAVINICGYTPNECIGRNIKLLINYEATGKKFDTGTFIGKKKDGTTFDAETSVKDVGDDNFDSKIVLFVIRDITERKAVERMKNEFVSTVSHELRTPLTSIRGSLGLIMSGKLGSLPAKVNSLLDIASRNCLRLINLINDILDIEKIEAGKMNFDIEDADIVPLIHRAIEYNIQYAKKFEVGIKFIDNVNSGIVNVDCDRLIQVITNLLSNAIKFSDLQCNVEVLTERTEDCRIKVSVTNYGTEISEKFKKQIFQKFAQADSSDSRKKGGTGLGLSISKLIIEKLNGTINFESKENKTTFYFILPEIKK